MMNNTGTHTIDSDQYATEVGRLMDNTTIQHMADDFAVGLTSGKITLSALDEWDTIRSARDYARQAGVDFIYIGSPAQAVYHLLKDQFG